MYVNARWFVLAAVPQLETLHVFTAVTVIERYKLNRTVPGLPAKVGKHQFELQYLENMIGGRGEISEAYAERRMSAIAVL